MDDVVVIEAGRSERHYWLDLWRYRELFRVLAWRDLSVRYKQTVIGVLWALIRPFLTMVVFTIIFGRIAKLPTDGNAPYALMVFAGILPWTFFSTGLSEASNSLINNDKLDQQGLFSTPDRADSDNCCGVRGFPHQLLHFARADGLVPISCRTGGSLFCPFSLLGFFCQRRSVSLDYLSQCEISGFPLRYPVHRAIRPLCVAGWIQFKRGAGAMAAVIFAQSNGRRDRRVSVVHSSRTKRTISARSIG